MFTFTLKAPSQARHLEAVFSDCGDVLSIDIDKAYIVTGAAPACRR